MEHNRRETDMGIGRLIRYWPALVALFSAGAWWESAKATAEVTRELRMNDETQKTLIFETRERVAKVEDAVLYLKQIVEIERHRR